MLFIALLIDIKQRINNIQAMFLIFYPHIEEFAPHIPFWKREIVLLLNLIFRYSAFMAFLGESQEDKNEAINKRPD
ncbi:hypothetical protein [Nitrosomonas communis]|uniref:Uncharacterized protein n=1 Tax=Nitrosomonas communis TaxID=44574 RepID=A0A1I4WZG0_9PROT|nr:hypothetical protein [Nitrosomonas communis]SFN19248.1 hypothetical protein SAMN05421863_11285 [Nitrosomonas communis]